MTSSTPEALALQLGRRLIDGIVAHDWAEIESCFEPDARLRAVVPKENAFRDRVGGQEAADQIRRWFGEADVTELVSSSVEPMGDRVHISYRIHEHEPDGWYLVEQQAYITLGDQGIAYLNLVCSGFRPVPN
jgi:hypothetical protein